MVSQRTATSAFAMRLRQAPQPQKHSSRDSSLIYDRNEYVHDLKDSDLKGLIVEATGLEPDGSTIKAILGSFKALKAFAKFDGETVVADDVEETEETVEEPADFSYRW